MHNRYVAAPSLVVTVLATAACLRSDETVVKREGRPPVYRVARTDPGMQAAIDSAQASLGHLIMRLRTPPPRETDLAVKVRVIEGETVEHLWVTDVTYDGAGFRGLVNNDPLDLRRIKLGDTLRFRSSEITDWMAVDDGKLVAGYTIRLLRGRMDASERARFDSSLDFVIQP